MSDGCSDVCSAYLDVPNGRRRRRAAVGQRELGNRPMSFFAIGGRLMTAALGGALALAILSSSAAAAELDDQIYTFFQLDQNEYRLSDEGEHAYAWDAQGWKIGRASGRERVCQYV